MKLAIKIQIPERLKIAILLFPDLELIPEGLLWDIHGLDAKLQNKRVQCKHDTAIARTNNIYHEMYEKTALNDKQSWRHTAANVDLYVFTTETNISYIGYLIPIDTLAFMERDRQLRMIYPNNGAATSMGFILPIKEFSPKLNPKIILKRDKD